MRRYVMFLAAAGVAAACLSVRPMTASASCAEPVALPTAIAGAPAVFVGTVTGLANGGRVATVRVDDVWKGDAVSEVVQVAGSPDLAAAATSVDRTYSTYQQYLFVPTAGAVDHFEDNSCSLTQPYSAALTASRPSTAHGPSVETGGSAHRSLVIGGLASAGALVLLVGIVVMYRRSARGVTR